MLANRQLARVDSTIVFINKMTPLYHSTNSCSGRVNSRIITDLYRKEMSKFRLFIAATYP